MEGGGTNGSKEKTSSKKTSSKKTRSKKNSNKKKEIIFLLLKNKTFHILESFIFV